jgi:UDPglucose--hexose-1-phosphate uridylyltransferase
MTFEPTEHPHRRYDPLRDQWVLVSPHRNRRPWQGQTETPPPEDKPAHDPTCYLCPGNPRAGGHVNPDYETTFVFTNDFAALLPDVPAAPADPDPLFRMDAVPGECRVICFSPRHDLTFAQLPIADVRRTVDLWADQTAELAVRYRWVQVFENKGTLMGASNPHPHGQIWALDALPTEVAREDATQRRYLAEHGRPLLLDYARAELARDERVVVANEHWLALVPYWASWPFELMLLPHARHVARLPDLTAAERDALADVAKRALTRLDNVFATAFAYSFGWHGAPSAGGASGVGADRLDVGGGEAAWQLHAHVYPPLLRSATVRKFMVGFEMLGEPQRDLTPEQAAGRLRSLSDVHYTEVPR